jgi:hypothetical protein
LEDVDCGCTSTFCDIKVVVVLEITPPQQKRRAGNPSYLR